MAIGFVPVPVWDFVNHDLTKAAPRCHPLTKQLGDAVSLAQKTERPPMAKLEVLAPSTTSGAAAALAPLKATTPIDFRQIARRTTAPLTSLAPATPARAPEAPPVGRPASDVALDLLSEVSTALPALMGRCQSLEETIATTQEQARADLEAANDVAREWQQIAHTLKVQVEELEKEVAAGKRRAEAAEQESVSIRSVAERSQKAAAEAECLSSLFQEKVIASFGVGSAGHSILESVRARASSMRLA